MSNPYREYKDYVRVNLPSGITYGSNTARYVVNGKTFNRYLEADRYLEYIRKFIDALSWVISAGDSTATIEATDPGFSIIQWTISTGDSTATISAE